MSEHGVQYGVAAPESLSHLSAEPAVGFWMVELGDRPRPPQDLGALLSLRRAMREFRPQLVHAHGVKAALLALLLPSRIPIVVTLHNIWHGGALTTLLRRLLPKAAVTVCVSVAVRESFEQQGIRLANVTVIPNGVTVPRRPERRCGDQVRVAYVGRLTEEKGIDVLVEAWSRLIAAGRAGDKTRLHLVVAGDGPLRSSLAESLKLIGEEDVLLGHREGVDDVYAGASMVVIPSRSEGQSLTALEGMSYGLPIIASEVGGLREVVVDGESGLLVPPDSAERLAEAILSLADDPERRMSMGEAGRTRVGRFYSLDRMLERTREAYESCLRRP